MLEESVFKFLQPVMTFAEIGEEMGITPQRVEQLYSHAIAKLRKRGMLPALDMVAVANRRRDYARARYTGQGGIQ